jgi:predicted methyltransferase/transcriptional regulator with XRE-family HTH domain
MALIDYAAGMDYAGGPVQLYLGDCIAVMREMPEASIDAIVTDPPYGLGFMGKEWDALPPGDDFAEQAFRVLKPGGHILAFGGTRTWHRLAVAVEDAGFEIRDSIAWLYGSGFPKSLDVSKAIDKRKDWKSLPALQGKIKAARTALGISQSEAARRVGLIAPDESLGGGGFMWFETGMRMPTREQYPRLKEALGLDDECDRAFEEAEREVTGTVTEWTNRTNFAMTSRDGLRRDAPATDAARQWQGWGTALKPAFEPIVVGRKPLVGTVAANVLTHGTGALNIDGARIGYAADDPTLAWGERFGGGKRNAQGEKYQAGSGTSGLGALGEVTGSVNAAGRFPANVILDESQAAALDEQSGYMKDGTAVKRNRSEDGSDTYAASSYKLAQPRTADVTFGGGGGASRFFYVPKREGDTIEPCDPAAIAEPSSSQPSQPDDSALVDAATSGCPEERSSNLGSQGRSMSATASASRPSDAANTPATSSTAPVSSPATQPAWPTQTPSPASSAATGESDTTRTTPSPSTSSGTAALTTSSDTSSCTGPGEAVLPIETMDSRFIYQAKAPKRERPTYVNDEGQTIAHATVKPLALMRYLIRLVTPPDGVVLDPFLGSGTTMEAAMQEGVRVIGVEMTAEYLPLIEARVERSRG